MTVRPCPYNGPMEITEGHITRLRMAQTMVATLRSELAPCDDNTREGISFRHEMNETIKMMDRALTGMRIAKNRQEKGQNDQDHPTHDRRESDLGSDTEEMEYVSLEDLEDFHGL